MESIITGNPELSLSVLGAFYGSTIEESYLRYSYVLDHIINIILSQQIKIKFLESKLAELTTPQEKKMPDDFRIEYTDLNDKQKKLMTEIKNKHAELFNFIEDKLHYSRELSLCKTYLQQSSMWAVYAVTDSEFVQKLSKTDATRGEQNA